MQLQILLHEIILAQAVFDRNGAPPNRDSNTAHLGVMGHDLSGSPRHGTLHFYVWPGLIGLKTHLKGWQAPGTLGCT
jgi:hypothetical protein